MLFQSLIGIQTGFWLRSVSAMQTYSKKEEALVTLSSFSVFPAFSGAEGMLRGVWQALLMHNKQCWSRLPGAWIQGRAVMLAWTLFWLCESWFSLDSKQQNSVFHFLECDMDHISFDRCAVFQSEQQNYWVSGYLASVLAALCFSFFSREKDE